MPLAWSLAVIRTPSQRNLGGSFTALTTRSSEYSLPRSSKMPLLLLEEKDGLKTNQTPERVGHWGTYENHESALGSI